MDSSVTSLKLVLDELGIPPTIETLDERKAVQKAVLLAQEVGVDLGYSFGWYIRGPYSPRLTRDYFALDEALAARAGTEAAGPRLRDVVVAKLRKLRPVLEPPDGVELSKPDWLELVASLRYLERTRNMTPGEADEIIHQQKERLEGAIPAARAALAGLG